MVGWVQWRQHSWNLQDCHMGSKRSSGTKGWNDVTGWLQLRMNLNRYGRVILDDDLSFVLLPGSIVMEWHWRTLKTSIGLNQVAQRASWRGFKLYNEKQLCNSVVVVVSFFLPLLGETTQLVTGRMFFQRVDTQAAKASKTKTPAKSVPMKSGAEKSVRKNAGRSLEVPWQWSVHHEYWAHEISQMDIYIYIYIIYIYI